MRGFHYLMKIGRLINVILVHSEFAIEKVKKLGIRGFLSNIYLALKGTVLNITRLKEIVENKFYNWVLIN
jgi:hypothetical protein